MASSRDIANALFPNATLASALVVLLKKSMSKEEIWELVEMFKMKNINRPIFKTDLAKAVSALLTILARMHAVGYPVSGLVHQRIGAPVLVIVEQKGGEKQVQFGPRCNALIQLHQDKQHVTWCTPHKEDGNLLGLIGADYEKGPGLTRAHSAMDEALQWKYPKLLETSKLREASGKDTMVVSVMTAGNASPLGQLIIGFDNLERIKAAYSLVKSSLKPF
eukprot:TRINITY_DN2916_c0_g4_i1.p1 TRINITY_DN2916_c0_g4~~TRINITY_DN2916_c0_g4_i1.p1  ORF type:complete len:249 (+),score=42.71 TRINITY_DN2916_c0_g4_i1:89-748(+)